MLLNLTTKIRSSLEVIQNTIRLVASLSHSIKFRTPKTATYNKAANFNKAVIQLASHQILGHTP